jgi:predicted nucleic acid-binding protein
MLPENCFQLNISVALALEYEDVLKRPDLVTAMSADEIENILDYIIAVSNLEAYVPRLRPSLHDPDEERILEVAVQCGATIVIHNRKDFEGAARFGVAVKTPSDILEILKG